MLVFPNAKINVGLNITERRTDGFHEIESCFLPVPWTDALEITESDEQKFETDGLDIPDNGGDNLCVKAFKLVQADYQVPTVKMHLLKNIPIGAGLGGGSSDAAFVIRALNEKFGLGISLEKQLDYARRLGSDCAFFILNEPRYCFGKGDQFDDIDLKLAGKWLVLVNPGIHISTAEAYAGVVPARPARNLKSLLAEPVEQWRGKVKNDFEATLFTKYPLLDIIKNKLYELGAVYASMSGSGSTLYGIFNEETDLEEHFREWRVWQGFVK